MIFSYLAIILLAFGVIGTYATFIMQQIMLEQQHKVNKKLLDELILQIAQPASVLDARSLYAIVVDSQKEHAARICIMDMDGVVIIDGFSQLNGSAIYHEEILKIVDRKETETIGVHHIEVNSARNDEYVNHYFFYKNILRNDLWVAYYAKVIMFQDRQVGIAFLSIPIEDVMGLAGEIRSTILLITALFGLASALVAFVLSSYISKPIVKMNEAMKKAGDGDFSQRAQVEGYTEIATLARTFNSMSEQLENLDQVRYDFISNVSHELKTPLSSIKVLIQTLQQQLQGHAQIDEALFLEFLFDIDSEIDRLTDIIGHLLVIVKLEEDDKELEFFKPIDVCQNIRETIHSIKPLIHQKRLILNTDISDTIILIMGDKIKLQQAIYNILDNAIKYTNPNGVIRIAAKIYEGKLYIVIEDSGRGIPQADLPNVFERFYRVDKARARDTGGSGLGLYITQKIIQQHKGSIDVKSQLGIGTTFTVCLPLFQPGAQKNIDASNK